MSAQYLRAKGLAKPIEVDSSKEKPVKETTPLKKKSDQSPQILEKIEIFLKKHGDKANWWWRSAEVPLFGISSGDSFLFRHIFNDAAYFYELSARQELNEDLPPAYSLEKPFNQTSIDEAWLVWEKFEKLNRSGLHITPLTWAEELSQRLPGQQMLLHIDLKNYKDGQLVTQFEKQLKQMRKDLEIPEPAKSAPKANRILNTGRSFRPIEALDVHRLSDDGSLRRHYADQLTEAKKDFRALPKNL